VDRLDEQRKVGKQLQAQQAWMENKLEKWAASNRDLDED
jgi:hypothetical protein